MSVASPDPEAPLSKGIRAVLPLLGGVWLSLSLLLVWVLLYHANTPGRPAENGHGTLLEESTAKAGEWTLAIFLHPHCPCSVASLEQAAQLAERHATLRLQIYLVRSTGCAEGWEEGRLSRLARSIRGALVRIDVNGQEARRCGAHTSGQTFLTDSTGRVCFQGGLTNSRGHKGNSDGLAAVTAWIESDRCAVVETAVFGCPLLDDDAG